MILTLGPPADAVLPTVLGDARDGRLANNTGVIHGVAWRAASAMLAAGHRSARGVTMSHLQSVTEEPSGLTDRDREILAFERQWWKYAGAKEQAVRELFDLSATRYYQVLNALIDSDAALEHDPMLVKRLRRLRASRQRARSARRLGAEA